MPDEDELFGIAWSFSSSGHYSTLNPASVKEIVDIVYEKIHNKY